jgi:hypothetical protein
VIRHARQQKGIPFGGKIRGDVSRQFHFEQQAKGRQKVEDEKGQRALCDAGGLS